MWARIERVLAHERAPWIVAIAAMLAMLPALGVGLVGDDLLHALLLRDDFQGPYGVRADWDVFRWVGADARHHAELMDRGFLPWWTAPSFRCSFFRPLSALLHAFDHAVLVRPWLMHAVSIGLYGMVVGVATRIYQRRIPTGWVAGFAGLLFAFDDAHSVVVAWLAARNALVAALGGFTALLLHDRWRSERSVRSGVAAPLVFGAALLGGELAVGVLGYLVSYAVFLDPGPARARAASLAGYGLVTLGWLIVYKGLGYGAAGGTWYVDPGSELLAYVQAATQRVPILVVAQLLGVPAMLWLAAPPEWLWALVSAAVLGLLSISAVLWRIVGRDPNARYFAVGSLLSLAPACAVAPQDRTLIVCGLGAMGVVALALASGTAALRGASLPWRLSGYGVLGSLAVANLGLGPALMPLRGVGMMNGMRGHIERADRSLPATTDGSVFVVVNANNSETLLYVVASRVLYGGERPTRIRELAHAIDGNDGEIVRLDERTVEVTLQRGFLDSADLTGHLVRSEGLTFAAGDRIDVDGMVVTVEAITTDGRPQRVRFAFDRPLEDPSLVWVAWDGKRWVAQPPPPVGHAAPILAVPL